MAEGQKQWLFEFFVALCLVLGVMSPWVKFPDRPPTKNLKIVFPSGFGETFQFDWDQYKPHLGDGDFDRIVERGEIWL